MPTTTSTLKGRHMLTCGSRWWGWGWGLVACSRQRGVSQVLARSAQLLLCYGSLCRCCCWFCRVECTQHALLCASELASFAGHSLSLSLCLSLSISWACACAVALILDAALVAEMGSLCAGCGRRSKEEEEEERGGKVEREGVAGNSGAFIYLFRFISAFVCAKWKLISLWCFSPCCFSFSLSLSHTHSHWWLGHTHMWHAGQTERNCARWLSLSPSLSVSLSLSLSLALCFWVLLRDNEKV